MNKIIQNILGRSNIFSRLYEKRVLKKKDRIDLREARSIMETPYLTEEEKINKLKDEGASDSLIRSATLFSQGRWKVKR